MSNKLRKIPRREINAHAEVSISRTECVARAHHKEIIAGHSAYVQTYMDC